MISNERLEELISGHEKAKKAARIIVPNIDTPVGDALLECLHELQRYRQAATAGVDEAAERLYDAVVQVSIGGSYNVPHRLAVPVVKEHLVALLAERDAVLSECREVAAYVANTLSQIPTHQRSAATRIIDRIEALTKGVGDGK